MKSKYAIIGGSRCGSTHYCDLLKSTNRAGDPQEFFNDNLFDYFVDKYANNKGFEDSIINGSKTENDVFGCKIIGREQLIKYLDSSIEFTHCIYLKRENPVAQAISRYKSWKSGVWHLNEKHKEIPSVDYSYDGIKWCYESVLEENSFYEILVKAVSHEDGAKVLEVSYENDLVANAWQTIVCTLNHLGVSSEELPSLNSNQEKVGNKQSLAWEKDFLLEYESKN